jgi:hypothetical protein
VTRRHFLISVGGIIFTLGGVAYFSAAAREFFRKNLALPAIDSFGTLFGGESRLDTTYTNFYKTTYEYVTKDNVDPAQWKRLTGEGSYYLVTAVKKKKGHSVERKFILTKAECTKPVERGGLGLKDLKKGENVGQPREILDDQQIDFWAHGKYLVPVARIYPRPETTVVRKGNPEEINLIREDLKEGRVKTWFVPWFTFN